MLSDLPQAEKDKQRYTEEIAAYVPPERPAPPPKKQNRGKAVAVVSDSSSEESSNESDTESESETDPFQTDGADTDADVGAEPDSTAAGSADEGALSSANSTKKRKAYDADWAELDEHQKRSADLLGYSEEQWERKEVRLLCHISWRRGDFA
jgi:hypothetical protein